MDTAYAGSDRQSVVTQDLRSGTAMMLEWTPEHVGRWLFHCQFQFHFSTDERVPVFAGRWRNSTANLEPPVERGHTTKRWAP